MEDRLTPGQLAKLESLNQSWAKGLANGVEEEACALDVMGLLPEVLEHIKKTDAKLSEMLRDEAEWSEFVQRETRVVGQSSTEVLRKIIVQRDELRLAISSPESVWANILRGTIARPAALDHYEECKAALEKATSERDAAMRALRKLYDDCTASDFNEHWDSYKNAEQALAHAANLTAEKQHENR